jgi:hypothetical protein
MSNYNFGVNEPPHRRWPVAWYNPLVLLRSAQVLISSGDQLRNFDRRELFTGTFEIIDLNKDHQDHDFWWDFMSDSGDSGNATYTVARAMQAPSLTVDADISLSPVDKCSEGKCAVNKQLFPCGKVLVLGGDLAYPGASAAEYQYRFIDMWEAARPDIYDAQLTVMAIPQNHDWFDNISAFNRHFIGTHKNSFLCANAPQKRSYFATRMPKDWWLFGFDFALVGDIDRSQFETFLDVINTAMNPGDNAILLYPEPYWTRPLGDNARLGYPKRYQRLEAALMKKGVRVRMRLAGDLHHYVRETAPKSDTLDYDDMLVTCGSGGAFLHPTHSKSINQCKVMNLDPEQGWLTPDLEERVRVGSQDCKVPALGQRCYTSKICYPNQEISKNLSWENIFALFKPAGWSCMLPKKIEGNFFKRSWEFLRNIDWSSISLRSIVLGNSMYPITLGFLYLLTIYCNGFVFSNSFIADGFVPASQVGVTPFTTFLGLWFKALFFSPLALGVHTVLLVLCCGIAREDGVKSVAVGAIHGVLHILTTATLFWLTSKITNDPLLKTLILIPSGIVVGGLLVGVYFAIMARLGYLTNNAFSALGHEGYKGFLRFKIDPQGNLHGYMIGTDKVCKRWQLNPLANNARPLWSEQNPEEASVWKIRDSFTLKN